MVDKVIQWMDSAKSRIYLVYIFWLATFFAPVVFVSLFVDQEILYKATGLLKNEYIAQEYIDLRLWQGWVYLVGAFISAAVMTWLMIWKLPGWIVNRAYQQEINNKYIREEMLLAKRRNLEDKRTKNIKKEKSNIEEEEKIVERQEDLESREKKQWLHEYDDFKKSNLFKDFDLIPRAIYEYYGNISVEGYNDRFEVPYSLVAYADSAGLINVDTADKRITGLTDKGRFFYNLYQIDKKGSEIIPF